jgi:hypothetical protein
MTAIAETVQESLTTNTEGLISVENLARLLETTVERLRPVVEHKCLRVVTAHEDVAQTIVMRPGQRAIEWLKTMFQPLRMIPLIPLKEAGKLWGITEREVMKYCRAGEIPVYSDPASGYLLTFKALKRLARARAKYYKPKRTDRASLFRYYLSEIEGTRWKDPPPYSKVLEAEIQRIARLEEPWRTVQCVEFVLRFRDAKTVGECFGKGENISDELRNSDEKIGDLLRKSVGLELKDLGI